MSTTPGGTGPQPQPGVDPGPGWRLRYWCIFGGQASSLLGSSLTQFVLLWWITDTTGSVSALATAGLAALLPQALLGPLGGIFADRYSRRALMIVTDLVSAACMAVLIALFLADRVELWHVYAMMAVRSAMQAFQQPAAAASTAMLVPASFIPRAAGLNQALAGLTLVAAAPLGALAIGLMPIGWALAIDVVTAVLGIVPLLLFRVPQARVAPEDRPGVWREFREGVGVVWREPGLRVLFGLAAAVTLVVMPAFVLVLLLVKEHFGGGAPEVALMEGLAGAGMVAGGAVVAALAPRRQVPWVLWGFALSCVALALTALAPSGMIWLATVWWAASGFFFYILGNGPLTALLQTTVPNQLQGRVLSLLNTLAALASPVGLALATPLGELLGIRGLFVLMGTLGGALALLGFASPALRRLDRTGGPAP